MSPSRFRRLPRFPLFVLACLLLSSGALAATLTRGPYLQNLKTHSVVVMWKTDSVASSVVRVRKAGADPWTEYACTIPATAHEMKISSLEPNTVYEYQVDDADAATPPSDPVSFQTFPDGSLPEFQFVAFGGHRNFPKDHRAVVEAILQRAKDEGLPRFILDTGDYTGNGELKDDPWDEQFFGPERDLMDRVCLFPVIGNHEVPGRWPRIPFRYFENFAVPIENSGTEYYYSFDFADAHFLMFDAYSTEFQQGSKQYTWIERDLKQSKKRWKFAAMHFPVYIERTRPSETYGNLEIREHLVPLFKKYGVTMVFSGDSHFYQRSEVDGIQYVCTGGGGAPLYTPGTAAYVRASAEVHHYTHLKIAGDQLTLRAFDKKNQLLDTVTVGAREPELPKPPSLNFVRRLPDATLKPGEALIVESRDAEGKSTPPPVVVASGDWFDSTAKSALPGLSGKGSRASDNQTGNAVARISPPVKSRGLYLISITTPNVSAADAPNTLFAVGPATVADPKTDASVIRGKVKLSAAETGDKWLDIGLFEMAPGDVFTLLEVEDEPGRFYFDAVKFTRYAAAKPDAK